MKRLPASEALRCKYRYKRHCPSVRPLVHSSAVGPSVDPSVTLELESENGHLVEIVRVERATIL